ncbi:MAG: formate dehydrogenase accessory sulfurtransferase FdhD [Acidimicrobiales bacterium]|jgi:FdhD protein
MTELAAGGSQPAAQLAGSARPATRHATTSVQVVSAGEARSSTLRPDRVATEEPMAIQVRGRHQEPVSVAVTMRTPGNDFELAAGFLVSEGLLHERHELAGIRYCDVAPDMQHYNVVTVDLTVPFTTEFAERHFFASSSCGICGKATLDQVEVSCPVIVPGPVVARSVIVSLPDALRGAQRIFEQTGGLHAAALFDAQGHLIESREDVGRHNAVDKIIGHAFLSGGTPLRDRVLLVSGRVSFEIVQKAAVAGIPITCAVSAPSSLAVEAGERLGMTVIGFLRGEKFNLYSHPERVDLSA